MSTNVGKKNIAHKGSGHGCVAPAAMSLLTPPAPPVPTPFPYTARAANASDTDSSLKVSGKPVMVEGSTMSLDPPANQPAQSGGGDVVTHATKSIAVMTMGSFTLTSGGKGVCATGDIAALNVITKQSKVAQMSMPLLEAGDFDSASKSNAAAAAMNKKYKRAYPPAKSKQCRGGHPVDLATGYVVDDATDLTLPGYLPLSWSRSYHSATPSHKGALGKGGWTHSFEPWIEPTEAGFRYHDEEGLPVDLGPVGPDGTSFHRGERLELTQHGRTFEVRSLEDRWIRSFSPLPGGRIALRSIRDARDHRIELEYEGDVLVRITDSVKREIRVASDEKGRVTRVEVWAAPPGTTDAPSLQTWFEYGYHPEGELAHHVNALGHAEGWEYDGLHRMLRATLRNGTSFHYEYDPDLGHCVRTWGDGGLHDVRIEIDFEKGETCTHGTNRARRYLFTNGIVHREETFGGDWAALRIYDADELLVAEKNGAGEETTYEHDARGNLVKQTDPAGNAITWEIQDDLPIRRVGPTGLETRYVHDRHGSLVGVTFPTGLSTRFDRDREGRLVAVHGRDGARAEIGYDDHANVHTDTSSRGAKTTYRCDALGRPVERIDPIGRRTRARYDLVGQLVEVLRADGTSLQSTYDRMGDLASITDALGHTTRLEHAGTGNLARVTQPDGQVYRFAYDSDERLVEVVNPRLEKYAFEYDRADQIVAERTFDDRRITYRYDLAGRVTRVDSPEGEWCELRHDKLGNIVEDRGEDVQLTFARDALGRVEKAVSQDVMGKVVTELERDRFGRITADIQNGRAVRYEYDDIGRRTARVLPDGDRTAYHHDEDNAFMGVTHDGKRVTIERDRLGRERGREGRGWKVESEYDVMDRLLSQRVMAPEPGGGAPRSLAERRYTYDAKGRLTSIDSPHAGLTIYRYDSIDQLVEASRGAARQVFEYDPIGSLSNVLGDLADVGKQAAWSFARGNRLRATDGAKYVEDARGRRIQRVERLDGKDPREHPPRGDELVTTYGWDTKDQLREVVQPDGTRVRFTYDAFGRRVRKDVIGRADVAAMITGVPGRIERRTVSFLWDGDVLCEEVDSGKPEAERRRVHVHEPGTYWPMLQIEAGETFAVVTDHLGTPRELVDESGRVAYRALHGAFGDVVSVTRDPGARAVESPFRHQGQYEDIETGLCYTRYRYFEAKTGRWLSPDPLGIRGGKNLYALDGNPIATVDPWGLAGPEATSTHITYVGVKNGQTYIGYASMPGNQTGDAVLNYRYGSNFDHFDVKPVPVFVAYGDKATARGLEQRLFEQHGGLKGTSNLQSPVGEGNERRQEYLDAADAELKKRAQAAAKAAKKKGCKK